MKRKANDWKHGHSQQTQKAKRKNLKKVSGGSGFDNSFQTELNTILSAQRENDENT